MTQETKVDLFHPAQPKIPGVAPVTEPVVEDAAEPSLPPLSGKQPGSKLAVPLLLGLLTLAGIGLGAVFMLWLPHRDSASSAAVPQPAVASAPQQESSEAASGNLPVGPGPIARAKELTKAWSAVHFDFRDPVTSQVVPALAVRLPGGELWGISLREPYGSCDMTYVRDLRALKQQYGFSASHPMVVDPCKGTVFDLAIYGNGPNGMVRGEIVSGTAVRPPIAIKIEMRGNEIVAVRSE